jgi:hypothetical protein
VTNDAVAEGDPVGTGAATVLQALKDAAAKGLDAPDGGKITGVARTVSSALQRRDNLADRCFVLRRALHDLALPTARPSLYLYKV